MTVHSFIFYSPEKSPRLAQRVDQLHRPGIHASHRDEENSENISDGRLIKTMNWNVRIG